MLRAGAGKAEVQRAAVNRDLRPSRFASLHLGENAVALMILLS